MLLAVSDKLINTQIDPQWHWLKADRVKDLWFSECGTQSIFHRSLTCRSPANVQQRCIDQTVPQTLDEVNGTDVRHDLRPGVYGSMKLILKLCSESVEDSKDSISLRILVGASM